MKKVFGMICTMVLVLVFATLNVFAVSITEDFEGVDVGDDLMAVDVIFDKWEWFNATPDSFCIIEEGNGGNVLEMTGYSELRTFDYIPAGYEFSLDVMPENLGDRVNVFVRGEMPGDLMKMNPKNFDTLTEFTYYEWDWYAENGGDGASGVGGSGVVVSLGESSFSLSVKKYAEDGLTVASDSYEIPYPADVTLGEYTNLKFTDDGSLICIYINGVLSAKVTLSSDWTTYASDETDAKYFKSATVMDAGDNQLGTTENTRIYYEGSQLAISTRDATGYFDNINLTYEGNAPETPDNKPTATTKPTATPKATQGSNNTVQDTPAATSTTSPGDTPSQVDMQILIVVIAVVVIVIVVVILAVAIPKKKKPSADK